MSTEHGKFPWLWIVLVGLGGCVAGAVGVGVYLSSRHASGVAVAPITPVNHAPVGPGVPDSPPQSDPGLTPAPGGETPEPPPASSAARPLPEREKPSVVSILGAPGASDTLDVPFALPKGMLTFLRGIDLLGVNKPTEAIPFFSQSIAADEENSDFYTARGSSYVVAEKMTEALPDLERALKLNPKNILASRMTRLAYLMLGEQLKASKYGHGSTADPDFLITEVGTGYGSRMIAQKGHFKQDAHDKQRTDAAIQKLSNIADMVASNYRSGEEKSVQGLFALGVEQFKSKDFDAARRSFRDVIAKFPYDWTSRYYHAASVLATGDPELARHELTYVLTWKRFLPEAYAARAMCAVKQNDLKRAAADLKTAVSLDAAKAADAQTAVAALQKTGANVAQENDVILWDALGQAAKNNGTFDNLADAALMLIKSVNAKRLRYDEQYQDKLLALCTAVRAAPQNADLIADLVEFVRDNLDVRSLQVSPYGAARSFRRQTAETKEWETSFAFEMVNEGLRADGNHARCWALKSALLLHSYLRCEEAEVAAQQALRFNPRLLEGHMALSDCYHEFAARWREKAAALRTPKMGTRSVRVTDQHGNYLRTDSETYSIPPSAADLARAAECDHQAELNEQREQVCLSNALACAKGTPQEPFYQALIFFLHRDFASARPWLEKAVQNNPADARMRYALSNCLKALGLDEESLEEFGRAVNLQETTAEVWLFVAWNKIEHNAWESARKNLLRARELDPSDSRVYAYMGVLNEHGDKDATIAQASYRSALAQEEAFSRLNGSSYADRSATGIVSPESLGLTMVLRLRLARMAFQSQPDTAIEYYLATAANENRMGDWGLAEGVKSAVLPNPDRGPKSANYAPPLVTLLKNNRIFAGQALLNKGKNAEAAAQFAAAENFANRLPTGGTAYLEFELEPQYVPFRVSSMPMYVKCLNAQTLIQQGKKEEARLELQQVRYYLANRLQEQRAMTDDPIPGLYERLAPLVGLR